MKIGIYIGSFNPVHMDHEDIVNDLINDNLDKMIIIPTNSNYHLKNNLVSYNHRYNMLKEVFKNNKIIISELEKEEYHFTYQNIELLKKEYINDDLYLIIGADNLIELKTWKNYTYLLDNCFFIIYKRNDIDVEFVINNDFTNYKNKFIIKEPTGDISSTFIRERLKNDKDVSHYLNKSVLKYIKSNKLYEVK